MLHYCDQQVDNGRTHATHVDDCDVTLAVCCGGPDAAWRGADLCYIEPPLGGGPRPGTPDRADPSLSVVRHVHRPGVGVLHHGEAWHYVEPLQSGERCTLVIQAMYADALWKEDFLDELAAGSFG